VPRATGPRLISSAAGSALALLAGSPLAAQDLAAQDHASADAAIDGEPATGIAPPLRDLTTDRPDTTESPFTIDAGHVQIETTILGYTRNRGESGQQGSGQWDVAATNVRIGLTDRFEIDLGWQPYGSRSAAGADRIDGTGDVVVRAKFNVWGNDGGSSALAILPFVIIPTDRGTAISGADVAFGALVPLALEIDDRFSLGLNAGLVVARSGAGESYDVAVPLTASLAVSWSQDIGTYYEVAAELASQTSVTLNTGLTWRLIPSLQLDAGLNIGITSSAPSYQPFVGFSVRF
jgi:hypothetical protein